VRLGLLIVVALTGCGDDCHQGESRCDGSQIWTCDESDLGGNAFRGLGACCAGSTCRDVRSGSDRVAVCSDSPDPDPRCPMFGNVCADATTLLGCSYGYSEVVQTCAGTCVDHGDGEAFCAAAASDLRCAQVPDDGSTCDGLDLLQCNEGTLLDQTACTTACVDRGQGDAFCSTGDVPDPRCPASIAWCDGDSALTCRPDGFVEVDTCSAAAPCFVPTLPDGTPIDAFCNARSPKPPEGCYGG